MSDALTIITVGCSSVDVDGAQTGGRLEDMGSFDKYTGSSPAIIGCLMARPGSKSAVITTGGDERIGHLVGGKLERNGANTEGGCRAGTIPAAHPTGSRCTTSTSWPAHCVNGVSFLRQRSNGSSSVTHDPLPGRHSGGIS